MKTEKIEKLLEVMQTLRGEHGCPWDKEQTIQSLRPYIIEEAFETVEALDELDRSNPDTLAELKKELGDLLLQVVFVSQIASEEGLFNFEDVAGAITAKLITRHPHVFGDEKVADSAEVLKNWNLIKKNKESRKHLLDGIPKSMPSVLVSQRYTARAASVGFDWENADGTREKIEEEKAELVEAIAEGDRDHIEEEFGDLMFAVVNYGRKLGLDSEKALKRCAEKFKARFDEMENIDPTFVEGGKPLEYLEELWRKAKKNLNKIPK
ncbi:nucleoside triphosphate pyrophosphohydrolase [bacterium]|nr:nucleoside triphosphate pyrophosphohydrolase [bacterium]